MGYPLPGHQPLAVLMQGDHRVVQCLGNRDAAMQPQGICAFSYEPLRAGLGAGLF